MVDTYPWERGYFEGEGQYDPAIGASRLSVPGPVVSRFSSKIDTKRGNLETLSSAVREASNSLPEGYSVRVEDGYNPRNIAGTSTPSLHSYGDAIDVEIINPQGKPVPNIGKKEGTPEYELYKNLAVAAYAAGKKIAPDFQMGWGGNFRNGQNAYDLMHFQRGDEGAGGTLAELAGDPKPKRVDRGSTITASDNPGGRFAASGIDFEQGRGGTSVRHMDPQEYLDLVPPIDDTDEADKTKRKRLMKSLDAGDEIEAIPSLEVAGDGEKRKIVDYDGRHRAKAAMDAGLDVIPVAFHGVDRTETPKALTGLTEKTVPFAFDPVPPRVSRETPSTLDRIGGVLQSVLGVGSAQAAEAPVVRPPDSSQLPATALGAAPTAAPATPAQVATYPWERPPPTTFPWERPREGAAGRVYVNEAGLPFVAPAREGVPSAPAPRGTVGSVLPASEQAPGEPPFRPGLMPFSMEGGFHMVQPDIVNAPLVGIQQAGQMMAGARPSQPTPELVSAATLGGGLAPGSRFAPQAAQPRPTPSEIGGMVPAFERDPEGRARELISRRFAEGERGGGVTAQEAIDRLGQARAEGQPLTLADISPELARLAGTVYRQGGAAATHMEKVLKGRDSDFVGQDTAAGARIAGAVDKYIATGSMRQTAKGLADAKSENARPLWDVAMEGGNMPPVERRLATDYGQASRTAEKAVGDLEKAQTKLAEMERVAARQGVSVPRGPRRLNTFLIRNGGIKDQSGEIMQITGGAKGRPGLIDNKNGMNLDDAAQRAWEEGYLEGTERPSINEFLDAVAQDHNMGPVYSRVDEAAAIEHQNALALNRQAEQLKTNRPLPEGERVSERDLLFQRDKVAGLRAQADLARENMREFSDLIKAGQEDGTLGLKSAVWSPYIGRLLKNPRVKAGINLGYTIERDLADGQNRIFQPKDYAVLGETAEGDPILGAMPNMKLLAVAKQGLDATIRAHRDPITRELDQEGHAVMVLRNGLVAELDRLNPDYKVARDQWAGDSAALDALRDGRDIFSRKITPEEIAEEFPKLSKSEKEFYQLGVADKLKENLDNTRLAGDESKAIINSSGALKRIRPIFETEEKFNKFIDFIRTERQMFETPQGIYGGSKTAERNVQDRGVNAGLHAARAASDFAHLNIIGGAAALYRAKRDLGLRPNPALNLELSKLLIDPNVSPLTASPGLGLLARTPLPKIQNTLRQMGRPIPRGPGPPPGPPPAQGMDAMFSRAVGGARMEPPPVGPAPPPPGGPFTP